MTAPAREWRTLPSNPDRVRTMANTLRAELGKNAAPTVTRWIRETTDTHAGIGITLVDLRKEIVQLDGAGVKPTRDPKPGRKGGRVWTEAEIRGGAA